MEMGAQTKYSALEAGAGIEELLKAGLSPAQVEAGGLEAALNLATAGGLDLAKASEIMSTALNAYKADAMTAADASNILAGTANASATSVEELQYGLAAVSAVASGVGQSFKDTNTALGLFANNGLKGSDAGTSLKTMLANLSPMTDGAATQMERLGLLTEEGTSKFYDAEGNIKSMAEIAGLLQTSLKDLNAEQRQQALYTMFGSDAIRAANILFKEGADGVKKFQGEMSKVTALDVAKEKMNNAAGAVEQFKGAMETMQIAVMTPLLPLIKDVALEMAGFVEKLSPEQIEAFGTRVKDAFTSMYQVAKTVASFFVNNWSAISNIIIGVGTAVLTFKAIMGGMAIVGVVTSLMKAYRAGTLAATLAQYGLNTAMLANPMSWVAAGIAALVAAGVLLYRNWDTVRNKTTQLWNKLGAFKGVATIVLGPLGLIIRAANDLAKNWDSTKSIWENVWGAIKRTAASAVNEVIESINAMIRVINKIPGVNVPIVAKVNWGAAEMPAASSMKGGRVGAGGLDGSHYHGLDRVPYDGYLARLHKGEKIVPRKDVAAYERGSAGGKTVHLTVNYHGGPKLDDQEMNRLFGFLVRKIEQAEGGGA